jgi:hypothetical protein
MEDPKNMQELFEAYIASEICVAREYGDLERDVKELKEWAIQFALTHSLSLTNVVFN